MKFDSHEGGPLGRDSISQVRKNRMDEIRMKEVGRLSGLLVNAGTFL